MDSLAEEYCAFTVAIVIVVHPRIALLASRQLSPSGLSSEVNNSEYGGSPDFSVNPLALHQGFHLFKKSIRKLGHTLIQMGCKGLPSVVEFMGLPEADRGWDIIFFNDTDLKIMTFRHELLDEVKTKAHYFMSQKGLEARSSSLSEIGAVLWQRQLPTCRPAPITPKGPEIVKHKRRKSSNELTPRQLSNCGKKVIDMVASNMCVNNEGPLDYLIAAIKETRNPYDSVCKKIFPGRDSDSNLDSTYEMVYDDIRVITSISGLPNKYVTFTNEEKNEVLKIFDIARGVLTEIEGIQKDEINYHASLTTKEVLKSLAGYSELVPSSIQRWNLNRGKLLKKTGRKVNSDFEASIWGKLMICEYEKRMVRFVL